LILLRRMTKEMAFLLEPLPAFVGWLMMPTAVPGSKEAVGVRP
jgi:hypothetical protein